MPRKHNIYLDHAAATPVAPEVIAAMKPYWRELYGNASSLHAQGQRTKQAIIAGRKTIASILNCQPDEIIFTSGGTESINLALKGTVEAASRPKQHIITTAVEHQATLAVCNWLKKHGHELTIIPVDSQGLIEPSQVIAAIKPNTTIISIIHGQNEIGTIEPITQIGKQLINVNRKRSAQKLPPVYFHTDACQTAGYIDLNVLKLHVDLLTLNASKIYGPKGAGLLYAKRGLPLVAQSHGGGQERNHRSGTENIAAIVGLATALKLAARRRQTETSRLTKLRDYCLNRLLKEIPDIRLNGHPTLRLPNNINVSLGGLEGEQLVFHLDRGGIAASTGSACSQADLEPSHVIAALHIPTRFRPGSLRLTLGRATTKKDLDTAVEALKKITRALRGTLS